MITFPIPFIKTNKVGYLTFRLIGIFLFENVIDWKKIYDKETSYPNALQESCSYSVPHESREQLLCLSYALCNVYHQGGSPNFWKRTLSNIFDYHHTRQS